MKKISEMTNEELQEELEKVGGKELANKSVSEMSDEELQSEHEDLTGSPWSPIGRVMTEAVLPSVDIITKPVQWAANLVDYPVSAIRGAGIQGIRESKNPESTDGSVISAAARGGLNALKRNPFGYDPESNYAQLEKEMGVTDRPIGDFTKPIEGFVPDFIENIPVNQATGLATEIVADPFMVAGKAAKGMGAVSGGTMAERAIKNTEKALVRISDKSPNDTSELLNKNKLDSVSRTMQEKGLIKYITNPKRLKEKLEGISVNKEGARFPGKRSPVKVTRGLLDEVGGELGQSIKDMGGDMALPKQVLADDISGKLREMNESISSGSAFSELDDLKTRKTVDGIIKTTVGKPHLTVQDLVDLKRAAQEYIYEINKSQASDVQGSKNLKNIYQTIADTVDDTLNSFAVSDKVAEPSAGLKFLKKNQEYSDLVTLKDIVKDSNYNALKELVPADMLPGMMVAGGAGAAGGMNPAVAAGGYAAARGIVGSMGDAAPSWTARAQNALDTGLPGKAQNYFNKARVPGVMMRGVQGNPGREPQALPFQLIEYQIPRDSEAILANKDVVLAKIAQMSNDPNLTAMFKDALETHPEKLTKVLPALVLKFPDLFEDDDYNRVDGKIFDPMLRQKALTDIRNSRKYSTREKAQLSKRLEMEGILEN